MAKAAGERKRAAKGGKATKRAPRKRAAARKPAPSPAGAVPLGRPLSSAEEIRIVQTGAPVALARELQTEVGLTQKELANALGIAHRTFAERMTHPQFGEDESDRVLRLKRIYEQTVDTFEGDKAAAVQWLHARNRALGDRVPLELLSTGTGARAVEHVLLRMEHGIYS